MLLLELAARPEYQSLLRDEICQVVLGEEGKREWTLASIDRLHKLDSFMRETRRVRPFFNSNVPFPIPVHPIPVHLPAHLHSLSTIHAHQQTSEG